ncbi:FixH family protein [Paenibacillus mucilaginosus]|uniref:Uncharacterized protein n=1 Tax=Paenibacillus mucilaginosus (strain KNP414) TaxID=1036673 RepID=F8FMS4_PAEMK|nr:FixH family protein [Paenibacillus mucilaginosus]AEI44245.1 hypothetical protein KNP414_05721 [Paenibacillus mucilaginosus KNP414]MCG7216655.1 FixH family protein [Paenibacillus mucilaginosus]WDM25649.1 FixH family protein [Paenibacillus mucilaginosus]
MRNWLKGGLLTAGAAAAALLWAAGGAWPGGAAEEADPPYREFAAGEYKVEVALPGVPAQVLRENPLAVSVRNAAGAPVSGAAVQVDITMPGMFCGTSSSELQETEPGRYTGSGIPLMPGRQTAGVTVRLPGGESLQVSFPFSAER